MFSVRNRIGLPPNPAADKKLTVILLIRKLRCCFSLYSSSTIMPGLRHQSIKKILTPLPLFSISLHKAIHLVTFLSESIKKAARLPHACKAFGINRLKRTFYEDIYTAT